MYTQSPHYSNYSQKQNYSHQDNLSQNKKKLTTPALIFCKSYKDSNSKHISQINSSLLNTGKSPLRMSNAKNTSLISRSPLICRQNLSFEKKSQNSIVHSKYQKREKNFDSISMRESIHRCENHEDRIASYVSRMDRSNIQYYCQKCAILLASQGYVVQKVAEASSLFQSRKMQASRNLLNNSQFETRSIKSSRSSHIQNTHSNINSASRKSEISNFLDMSKQLLEQIQVKKDQIKQNLIRSEEFYGEQIEEVNDYFELVYKSLELQKNKCYNYILNQRVEVQKPARLISETISELKQKIYGIIEDIQENIQTVYQTEDQIYRPVIQQYQDNYQDIQKSISKIQVFEIQMRKIDFEGVPDSVFYLSDILKDSIEQTYQFENQKKMNEQLNYLQQSLKQSLKQPLPRIQPRKLFSKRSQQSQDQQFVKQNNKFCFSFEGQALQAQLEQQKIIYELSDQ